MSYPAPPPQPPSLPERKPATGTISPDGRYRFDGLQWAPYVPPPQTTQVTVSAGTAFKIGFFGSIGAVFGTAIFWIILVVVFATCAGGLAALGTHAIPTP